MNTTIVWIAQAGRHSRQDAVSVLGDVGARLEAVMGGGVPMYATLISAVMVAGIGLRLRAALRRLGDVRAGVWLEILAPADASPAAAMGMWRMLAGALHHTDPTRLSAGQRRGWWGSLARGWGRVSGLTPRPMLALEFFAEHGRIRAGVWVPGGLRASRIRNALVRACPGTRVRQSAPPVWHRYPDRMLELHPAGGARLVPLIDPTTGPGSGQSGEVRGDSDLLAAGRREPLRAVLDALAASTPGEQACVQLVVSAPTGGLANAARSLFQPGQYTGGPVTPGSATPSLMAGLATALAGTLTGAVAGLVELLLTTSTPRRTQPGSARAHGGSGRADAGATAARTLAAKRAATPQLCASLRVAVCAPTDDSRTLAAARMFDIAGGFDLITTETLRMRWRSGQRVADSTLLRQHGSRPFFATLTELAGLWHLPTDPARHHLPTPPATTHRPPRPALRHPSLHHRAPHHRPPSQATPRQATQGRTAQGQAAQDGPGVSRNAARALSTTEAVGHLASTGGAVSSVRPSQRITRLATPPTHAVAAQPVAQLITQSPPRPSVPPRPRNQTRSRRGGQGRQR